MDIQERILENMKAAMKDREKVRVAALRLIRDAFQKTEINERIKLDDTGAIAVLSKLKKQREESISAYQAGGRQDLVEREQEELQIIREFMPEPMGGAELENLVKKAIAEAGAASPSDMGKVMKGLKGSYEGRADGKQVSLEVKRQLAAISGS